jgi:hypothetical protein
MKYCGSRFGHLKIASTKEELSTNTGKIDRLGLLEAECRTSQGVYSRFVYSD